MDQEQIERNPERGILEIFYAQIDLWARPLLQNLGELEWGRGEYIITLKIPDSTNPEKIHGWILRKLAGNNHYHVGICSFPTGEEAKFRFFIKTGGKTVLSEDLTEEALEEALEEATIFGPTHLESLK